MRRLVGLSLSALTLAVMVGNVGATALPVGNGGILNKGSYTLNSVIQDVAVQGTCIDWEVVPPAACANTGTSLMAVSGDNTLFTAGSASIKNLNGSLPVTQFETVAGPLGNVFFDLLSIVNPNPAIYPTCTATSTSPCYTGTFLLTPSVVGGIPQLAIQLTTQEVAYTGTSATGSTPYVGIFTTQLSGTLNSTDAAGACIGASSTIASVLACQQGGGTIYNPWSATESPGSVTPEPISFVILGSGLVGLSILGRRRSRRS
jgi:hypothetical protein